MRTALPMLRMRPDTHPGDDSVMTQTDNCAANPVLVWVRRYAAVNPTAPETSRFGLVEPNVTAHVEPESSRRDDAVMTRTLSSTRRLSHPFAHRHCGGRAVGRPYSTGTFRSPRARRPRLARRVDTLRGAVLADAVRQLVRITLEPLRDRQRLPRAVPVSPVDVGSYTVRPLLGLQRVVERDGCGVVGEAGRRLA